MRCIGKSRLSSPSTSLYPSHANFGSGICSTLKSSTGGMVRISFLALPYLSKESRSCSHASFLVRCCLRYTLPKYSSRQLLYQFAEALLIQLESRFELACKFGFEVLFDAITEYLWQCLLTNNLLRPLSSISSLF